MFTLHPLFSDQSPVLACQPAPRNMKMEAGWQQFNRFISPFRKREMKEGFSQRRGVRFNQHFRKNCPFWLAASTTKHENGGRMAAIHHLPLPFAKGRLKRDLFSIFGVITTTYLDLRMREDDIYFREQLELISKMMHCFRVASGHSGPYQGLSAILEMTSMCPNIYSGTG
jgi:hypothetical protein